MKQFIPFIILALVALISAAFNAPEVGLLASASLLATVPGTASKKSILETVMKALQNFMEPTIQAAALSLASGSQAYHGGELAVGTMLFSDEGMTMPLEDGVHPLQDGRSVTVQAGAITEISEAQPAPDAQLSQALAALAEAQAKVTALESAKAAAEAKATDLDTKYKAVHKDLLDIKAMVSGDNDGATPPAPKDDKKPLSVAEKAAKRAK